MKGKKVEIIHHKEIENGEVTKNVFRIHRVNKEGEKQYSPYEVIVLDVAEIKELLELLSNNIEKINN